jgi:uncharacterized protein (TIGR03437 family)
MSMGDLPVTYAGSAPGMAAGILQVNFVAPASADPQYCCELSIVVGKYGEGGMNVLYFTPAIQ